MTQRTHIEWGKFFDDLIRGIKITLIRKELALCTESQKAMFYRVYPGGIEGLRGAQMRMAFIQCARTAEKNKEEADD